MPLMARGVNKKRARQSPKRNIVTDLGFREAGDGAGEGNRTRTISLGSTPIGAVVRRDLRRDLSLSGRI